MSSKILCLFLWLLMNVQGLSQDVCMDEYKFPIACTGYDTSVYINEIGTISVDYYDKGTRVYKGVDVFSADSVLIERIRLNSENNTSINYRFENGILISQSMCIKTDYCMFTEYYPVRDSKIPLLKRVYHINAQDNYDGWYIEYREDQTVLDAKYYVNGKLKKKGRNSKQGLW